MKQSPKVVDRAILEARQSLARIEIRLEQTITKADLFGDTDSFGHAMKGEFSRLIRWVVGTGVAVGLIGAGIITFVLQTEILPTSSQAVPLVPIVILVVPAGYFDGKHAYQK